MIVLESRLLSNFVSIILQKLTSKISLGLLYFQPWERVKEHKDQA